MAPLHKHSVRIAESISINGDIVCEEDLIIDGSVAGSVELRARQLTVGRPGRVNATLRAQVVQVDGLVVGDVIAEVVVVVSKTGTVQGTIVSPGVVIENGGRLNGRIDMSPREVSPTQPE